MMGGTADWVEYHDSAEVFSGGQWRYVGPLPARLMFAKGVTIANTVFITGQLWSSFFSNRHFTIHLYIFAGGMDGKTENGGKARDDLWEFDDKTETWTTSDKKMAFTRSAHALNTIILGNNVNGFVCQYNL